ncbi:MAG: hypothetical protein WC294_00220 [Methanoregula sp.]|jgi:hypothetical protein
MKNFDYEKAYFVQALPAFRGFNQAQKTAHDKLLPLVKDLTQQRVTLNIPVSDEMTSILSVLSCQEIAELSRASYFVGHWKPGHVDPLFENSAGESWKISNVCDQILRSRFLPYSNDADQSNPLQLPHNIQIHEGKFRVTFSNKNCWLWAEFGLATERNLTIFKTCGLSFGENSIENGAKVLAIMCGDLWEDVDEMPGNREYDDFLTLKKAEALENLKKRHAVRLANIAKGIENSKIELAAFTWLIENGIKAEYIENCIYYSHTGRFCFGWRNPLTEAEKAELKGALCEFMFDYDFK